MKKLIAIAVVFALVAGAAFAQIGVEAGGAFKSHVLKGDSETKKDGIGTDYISWFWASFSATTENQIAGAKASLSVNPTNPGSFTTDGEDPYAYALWQPIPQVFFKLGKVGKDGKYWAGAGIGGWDFQSNDLLMSPAFNYYNGYPGSILGDSHGFFSNGIGKTGMQLTILPIEPPAGVAPLAINFGFNYEKGGKPRDVFIDSLAVQVVYKLFNIGLGAEAAVGFVNDSEGADKDLYAQYKMNITNDIKVELGVHFPIKWKDGKQAPLNIGVGFGYGSPWTAETLFVNVRAGASIGIADGDPTNIGLDICPSYDLGILRVYVPVGVAFSLPDGGGKASFGWSVNPYIRKNIDGYNISFWAGLQLYNGNTQHWQGAGSVAGDSGKQVNWAVPIAILWYF